MQLNKGYLYQNKIKLFFIIILDHILSIFPKKNREFPDQIHKILIIKPDHLGDMLNLTSVFPLIGKKFPGIPVDIVANKWSISILENNPYVRNKYCVNHWRMNREKNILFMKIIEYITTFFQTLQKIKKESYDLCLVMRAYGNNLIGLAKLGNCRYIIGHKTGGFGHWLDDTADWKPGLHEVQHFLEVLSKAGINSDLKDLHQEIYPSKDSVTFVDKIQNEYFSLSDKIAVVHPGAGDIRKSLSVENWKFIVECIEKLGYRTAITGIKAEKGLCVSISSGYSINLCGKFNIPELAQFYRKASLIITVDTLSAHLGGWSGVKTIVFYSGINDSKQWRPLGGNIKIIEKNCIKIPCFKGCKNNECMDYDFPNWRI